MAFLAGRAWRGLSPEYANAYSGEEYRQELRQGLISCGDEIKGLAWAVGSGFRGLRKGHFFCAAVGDRSYLRFVPFDGGAIVDNLLGCLRLVTCAEDTARHVPDDLRTGVYAAWEKAREHIYDEWTFYTDPANVQPRVSGLLRRVAQHLRTHPPRHIAPERLHDILNSVETPLPRWQEQEIRETFNAEQDDVYAVSAAIVEKVQELGLQPPAPASPLPVIDRDEIHLIVWMAVDDD